MRRRRTASASQSRGQPRRSRQDAAICQTSQRCALWTMTPSGGGSRARATFVEELSARPLEWMRVPQVSVFANRHHREHR
jgi:hypothetical protein